MATFAEFIAESFDSDAPVNWKLKSGMHAVATFTVKSIAVDVDFEQREPKGPWHVSFDTRHGDIADLKNEMLAIRRLNGVFQAVRQFLQIREPGSVVFIAKDEDRAALYAAYLRRENSAIESLGYQIEGPHAIEPYTQWTLRRVQPSTWKE
ncbi:MAG TPA: hypothetical protein DEQ47_14440 [Solibacterales bacterium]|nr:hypothetical protein [Bryobacterales bacterium]